MAKKQDEKPAQAPEGGVPSASAEAADSAKPEPEIPAWQKPFEETKDRKPIEHWFALCAPPLWLHRGAKIFHKWAIGEEVTRTEYVAGLTKAANVDCR